MKTFQFKIKSYDNEEGEYSAWQTAESGTIIQLILNHWFNENLPNNLDVVVIKNSDGDQLVLDHERKDVFRYFFVPKDSGRHYYYKMTDITLMFFTLESFFNHLPSDLVNNLNKTTDDWRWVKGDFLNKNFHYKIKPWRLIKHFAFPAMGALLGLIVLLTLIIVEDFTLKLFLGGAFLILLIYIWRLKHKFIWYLDQRNWEMILSRGDRFIHLIFKGNKKSIPKSDIVSINQQFELDDGMWFPVYTQINFSNGCVFNVTDLMMRQWEVKDKFLFEGSIYNEIRQDRIALKKRTDMAAYFPDALNRNYLR